MTEASERVRRVPAALGTVGFIVGARGLGVLALGIAAASQGQTAHRRLVRWDANWYAGIAAHGYGFVRIVPGRQLRDYAFFPLYPALERALHTVTGLGYRDCGLVLAWLATGVAAWGIYAVGTQVADQRTGLLLAALWTVLPMSIVLSMAYSEALFVALAAWALYATLARRWWLAGLLSLLAGLTRPLGAAVAAAVLVAALVELRAGRAAGHRARLLGSAVLAMSGFLGYIAWVGWRRHDPLGYFAVQDGWGNGVDGGRAFGTWLAGRFTDVTRPAQLLLGVAVLAAIALVVSAVVWSVRDRQPLPLLVYSVVVVVIALMTARYFGSKPRYLLPAFPLLLPAAQRLAHSRRAPLVLGVAALVSAGTGAAWLMGSAPP